MEVLFYSIGNSSGFPVKRTLFMKKIIKIEEKLFTVKLYFIFIEGNYKNTGEMYMKKVHMLKEERIEKLHVVTVIGTLLALIFMVVYNYFTFNSNATQNMEDIGASNLGQATEKLEGYLAKGLNVVQSTAVTLEYMMKNKASAQEIEEFLVYESEKYKTEIDENFTGIYGLFNNIYIDGIGWVPDEDYDPRTREWYVVAQKAKGKTTLVSPYLDAQTGTIMMSVSKVFSDNDSVISLDIELAQIQDITEDISLNGMGYGFVVDKDGLVVAHNDTKEKGKNYCKDNLEMNSLLSQVYKKDKICFEMNLSGETYRVFSESVMEDWYVVMVVSEDKLFYDVNMTLRQNILICGIISALIIFFYLFMIQRIKKSMKLERDSKHKIEQMNRNIVRALVRTIDAKDRYTNGHSLRVANYSLEIAKRMNKSPEEREKVYFAGLLHDVGKIRISEELINKKTKLTNEEYEQINIHPVTGFHILKDIYEDKVVATGAKFHHERYDGTGYPNGLVGDNIPEVARIVGIADSYDAMASTRSYRDVLPQEVVREELEKGKGTQFDPEIADIMLQMIDEDKEYSMKENKSLEKTILIVDDEPMNIKIMEVVMKDEPLYKIIEASSGKEALELLDQHEIDLVLLDIQMPEMDGFETLSRMREKYDIPVIFMTGDKTLETITKATDLGVDDYINKPFMPLTVKEIIHSIFNY